MCNAGACEVCQSTDHYVRAPCHCRTCLEAAALDPASRLELPATPESEGETIA